MKKVYTESDIVQTAIVKSILDANDIQFAMKNEAMSAMFGSAGHNIFQAYPEIWVADEDVDKATELIDRGIEPEDDA